MIPFYIFYSMFGFQRVGDLAWAAGDSRCRGFLLGGTAGRTTLNGEGLQHADGHSHVLASTIPNCVAYDPTYAYEVAVIIHDGLRRMLQEQEDVFYYITLMNENYLHPAMPEGVRGRYSQGHVSAAQDGGKGKGPRVQLLGSGTILREAIARGRSAAETISASLPISGACRASPSCGATESTSSAGTCCIPRQPQRRSYVETCLADRPGPVVAATDYIKTFADQIRPYVPQRYRVLGTDGFGRSDDRARLRSFFESRSPLCRGRRAQARWPTKSRFPPPESMPRSRSTASIRKSRIPRRCKSSMGALVEIKIPDIGDFTDVDVIEVMVKPGDPVARRRFADHDRIRKGHHGSAVAGGGVVKEIKVKIGDKVSEGSPIVVVETAAGDGKRRDGRRPRAAQAPAAPAAKPAPPAAEASRPAKPLSGAAAAAPAAAPSAAPAPGKQAAAEPQAIGEAARRPRTQTACQPVGAQIRARTRGRFTAIKGTGFNGRIFRNDVQKFVKAALAAAPRAAGAGTALDLLPWPKVDFAKFGADRNQSAVAHQEILESQPGAQLGDDSARHPVRRGRRHRTRGLAQRTQPGPAQRTASESRCWPSCSRRWLPR